MCDVVIYTFHCVVWDLQAKHIDIKSAFLRCVVEEELDTGAYALAAILKGCAGIYHNTPTPHTGHHSP